MTDAILSSDTAVKYDSGGPAVLKKKWIVPSVQTTSIELDKVVINVRETEALNRASSSTFCWFEDSDVQERLYQRYTARYQVFISEMLEEIESGVISLVIGSANISTPAIEKFSKSLDASTAQNDVDRLFSLATFIDLEPGMTNEFSEGLEDAIERFGEHALNAIEDTVLSRNTNSSIAMEAMQYVGYTDTTKWHDERRRTLERCLLKSPSAWVRDGAGLGLASLDDPKSIPALERAILAESSLALKEDLTLVLNQLLDTQREQ